MHRLTFYKDMCAACETHDCLMKCQHLDLDLETARMEMDKIIKGEDSFVLHDCVTCYACEEYCPNGNHPFYLIVQTQEDLHISPLPDPLVTRGIQTGIPFRGEPEIKEMTGTALNMGVFSNLMDRVGGRLFEGLPVISEDPRKMFHYFCQLMYLHYGKTSVINDRLVKIIETIAAHKAEEVVHFHDECYGTYMSYAPAFGIDVPFSSVHLFEYLYNKLVELKEDIKPLNYKVAYQRPCSSRLSPDKHPFVAKIFDLIGVEEVDRTYVGENALCCGATILGQKKQGSRQYCADIQEKNIADMKNAGAQICVFNCPACMQTLATPVSKAGMMPLFMSDLCRLAIGEKIG
ncbi:MAG: (Fe-S)-binding protein [Desulfobacteraceae bacterium]|nr:(Fe-S)-binding protein [Desulfobacteraceae bacterium]MBU4053527.1 (Fe-S)-binding protein [Pseudomonadota bacterium]